MSDNLTKEKRARVLWLLPPSLDGYGATSWGREHWCVGGVGEGAFDSCVGPLWRCVEVSVECARRRVHRSFCSHFDGCEKLAQKTRLTSVLSLRHNGVCAGYQLGDHRFNDGGIECLDGVGSNVA